MATRLSHSAVRTYTECGQKYKHHYINKYRNRKFGAALAFGTAVDEGIKTLLHTKDLTKAKAVFVDFWSKQKVYNNVVELKEYEWLRYSESDYDDEILDDDDRWYILAKSIEYNLSPEALIEKKEEFGYPGFSEEETKFYNLINWVSLRKKGFLMMEAFQQRVLHKITKVHSIQEKSELTNEEGDVIVQYSDLIVELDDGKNYLLDVKTSTKRFQEDSAGFSQQLIVYYHTNKDKYSLAGVGFIVLQKIIKKDKTKTCPNCSKVMEKGARHTKCPNCSTVLNVKTKLSCNVEIILDKVSEEAENLVMATFDEANEGIKSGNFYKNLSACRQGPIICPFFELCWKGDKKDIIDV